MELSNPVLFDIRRVVSPYRQHVPLFYIVCAHEDVASIVSDMLYKLNNIPLKTYCSPTRSFFVLVPAIGPNVSWPAVTMDEHRLFVNEEGGSAVVIGKLTDDDLLVEESKRSPKNAHRLPIPNQDEIYFVVGTATHYSFSKITIQRQYSTRSQLMECVEWCEFVKNTFELVQFTRHEFSSPFETRQLASVFSYDDFGEVPSVRLRSDETVPTKSMLMFSSQSVVHQAAATSIVPLVVRLLSTAETNVVTNLPAVLTMDRVINVGITDRVDIPQHAISIKNVQPPTYFEPFFTVVQHAAVGSEHTPINVNVSAIVHKFRQKERDIKRELRHTTEISSYCPNLAYLPPIYPVFQLRMFHRETVLVGFMAYSVFYVVY